MREAVRAIVLLLPLVVSLAGSVASSAQAQSAQAQEAPPPASGAEVEAPKNETETDRARFEELYADREAALAEAEALDADAATAIGQDAVALQDRALALRLDSLETFGKMAEVIEKLKERNENVSSETRALVSLLPGAILLIKNDFQHQRRLLQKMKEAQDTTDAESAAAQAPSILRRKRMLLELLDEGVGLIELATSLGVATDEERETVESRVSSEARLVASQMGQARAHLDDLAARFAAGGDAAALQVAEGAERLRLDAASQNLETLIGMLERLELDASTYRRLLVESTGELTIATIDRDVAGDLISRWIGDLREGIAANGPSFVFRALVFALIFAVFWGLSRFTRNVVARAVEAPHLRFSQLLKRMIVSLTTSAVILLGLLVALSQLGIEVAPMLAGLGIAGFVLGFALQDTLGNFAAGIMILIYRPFDVGDMIDCAGGVFGNVNHMSLVSTTILTIDNKTLIVPNSKIWGDVITNVTAQSIRRVDLEFGIGYGDDIPKAEAVLESILSEHPKVLADPEPVIRVHSLGDSSVNFIVRPWCSRDDYWDVAWDVTREVKLRFDREGVSIPFPQRDVHFYPAPLGKRDEDDSSGMQLGSTSLRSQSEPDAEEA